MSSPTLALLAQLPLTVGLPERAPLEAFRRRPGRRARGVGQGETWGHYMVRRADEISQSVVDTLSDPYGTMRLQAGAVLADLATAYRELDALILESIENGALAAANSLGVLLERIAEAIGLLGEGLGVALRGFLGFSPAEALGGAALFLLVLAAFGVYVAVSPGAQAAIASWGAGAGAGLKGLGVGYGAGIKGLGVGLGKAAPVLLSLK